MNPRFLFLSLFLFSTVLAKAQRYLVACGGDQAVIIDSERSGTGPAVITWKWSVKEATGLPDRYQKLLVPLDECKLVDNNRKLLLTSSGGGVVLLDIKSKKILFYAYAPMAHSAALLPGNRVAVALSTHPKGNSLELYDLKQPEKVLYKDSLYSGHGVVWDEKREQLYALGFDSLRAYTLHNWQTGSPGLHKVRSWPLPDEGGHDLVAVSDDELLVSTHHSVWRFSINENSFAPFGPLKDKLNIKSVNYDRKSKRLVYTQAEESWWTHNIYIKNPDQKITVPDIRLYKVRVMESRKQ